MIFMAAKKKETKKTKSTTKAKASAKTEKKEVKKATKIIDAMEPTYSFKELADIFGISKIKAKAYFNMAQLDYSQKITIKKARELFNKF